MPGTENPNLPTYGLSEAAVEERQPEVPNASFEGGGNEAASNSPGIGINTGDYDPKPSDWSREERAPQTFGHIGLAPLLAGDIRVDNPLPGDNASFVQASQDVPPGEFIPGTAAKNETGSTVPAGSWLWAPAVQFVPESLALFNAMEPSPNEAQQIAINNFIVSVLPFWEKFDWLQVMHSYSEQPSLLNWVNPAQVATAENSPTFLPFKGWKGDGVSSYINVPAARTKFILNDGAISACSAPGYIPHGIAPPLVGDTAGTSGNRRTAFWPVNTGNAFAQVRFQNESQSNMPQTALDGSMVTISRSSGAGYTVYKGGEVLASPVSASTTISGSAGWYILRSATSYSDATASFFAASSSLTQNEAQILSSAWVTYLDQMQGEVVPVPDGFPFTPELTIRNQGDGTFSTDINPDSFEVQDTGEVYYLSPVGNDGNDGLTPGTPKKSIYNLVTALNSGGASSATLYIEPGVYEGSDGTNNASFAFDFNLICESGVAICTYLQAVSWTQTPGYTNIWQTSNNGTPSASVVDRTDIDNYGIERRLAIIPGSDLSELEASPGSLQGFGGVLYVHLHDGREPDDDVMFFGVDQKVWTQTDNVKGYVKNVRFYGGESPVLIGSTQEGKTLFFNNTQFNYSHGAYNGFETSSSTVNNNVYHYFCAAAYNRLDGLGYRGKGRAIEVNTKAVWNGYVGSSDQDNGSTAHEEVAIIRINGTYRDNGDRNIHDVNGVATWNLGCISADPKNGSSTPWVNGNYIFGASTSPNIVRAWLDECVSEGGATIDLGAQGDAIVYYRNCTGFDIIETRTGGQVIEGY